jgi:hypothetical protein
MLLGFLLFTIVVTAVSIGINAGYITRAIKEDSKVVIKEYSVSVVSWSNVFDLCYIGWAIYILVNIS